VINDLDGYKIASCFIMGDVAHDVYCTTWEQHEEMARYLNPYIPGLADLKIVYVLMTSTVKDSWNFATLSVNG
jgi:hypothetical protein